MAKDGFDKLFEFQDPQNFFNLVNKITSPISDEDLLSRGKDDEQKLQEALVASPFALGFQKYISPIQIRMATVQKNLMDFELLSSDNTTLEFEIVMVLPPNRKLREEYQKGKQPEIAMAEFSGKPINPEWVASQIRQKTEKAMRSDRFNGHLLVYMNVSGGTPDLLEVKRLISDSESIWQSIWLIRGVPDMAVMVLLYNSHGFCCVVNDWLQINGING